MTATLLLPAPMGCPEYETLLDGVATAALLLFAPRGLPEYERLADVVMTAVLLLPALLLGALLYVDALEA